MPRLYMLVDTSGSISERQLTQFASEIYAATKHSGGEVVVVAWDAKVQGEFMLKRPSDIKKVKFRGGGGTEIGPALEYVLPRISPRRDAVVVLTDGHIFDIKDPRTVEMLKEVGRRAAVTVFVTTDATPPRLKSWRIIRIEE